MRKLIAFIFLNYCFAINAQAQSSFPPFYEIKIDTIDWQNISDTYWQILEDKEGRLMIEDIAVPANSDKFHSLSGKKAGIDSLVNTYWFRYRLKNTMSSEAKIALNSLSEYDDFYLPRPDGKWNHFSSGRFYDLDKKTGLKNADCIPVVLQPGEELTVYQRISNKKKGLPDGFAIAITSTEKIIQDYYINDVDSGKTRYNARDLQEMFLEGLLLLSFFINLFFFRIVRKKEYLYFSLFLLTLAIDRLINVIGTYLRWEHPSLYDYLGYINLSWIFILLFLIQFVRMFFKIKLRYRHWDKFLLVIALIAGGFNLYATIFYHPCFFCSGPSFYFTVYSIMISLNCISVFITFLLYFRIRDVLAKLVITGGAPLMLYWGLSNIIILQVFAYWPHAPSWMISFLYSYRTYEVACIAWFVLFFSLILFIQFNQLRKENAQQILDKERLEREREIERRELVEQQKTVLENEVAERTSALTQSLEELKSTQKQLIQSEKMASLGELTAGIAHEIQNPLNFVNNFSEINKELVDELKTELATGNFQQATEIADDIKENEEKINHHGKRADAIVKGMLQHSRTNTGQKELTDINALADEYLRLAYHGMRAKEKSFNAEIKTDFDGTIRKINVVPQEIGRVLLNLYNNAFYAVNEKRKTANEDYQPSISVSTKKLNDRVEIRVADNGNGIPSKVIDKIFQPFFTTKPTGQGTGLGLSLSYDIIKAHGGEIKVETKEGEGSQFIIQVPLL